MFRKRKPKEDASRMNLVIPELKNIISTDIDYGQLPPDTEDCQVACQADIGPKGGEGEEIFFFTVVTPIAIFKSV